MRYVFFLLLLATLINSCIQEAQVAPPPKVATESKPEAPFRIGNVIDSIPTGVPVPTKGKWVDPTTVEAPKTLPLRGKLEDSVLLSNASEAGSPQPLTITTGQALVLLTDTLSVLTEVRPAVRMQPVPTTAPRIKETARYDIQCYGVDQGMTSSYVWSMLEDSKGILWLGTLQGATRFDGSSFTHFSTEQGLSEDNVWSIIEDRREHLWFATSNGAIRYDGHSFIRYLTESEKYTLAVQSLLEDSRGNIWLGTFNGVIRFQPDANAGEGSFVHFTLDSGVGFGAILSMLEDSRGHIWFGTSNGAARYDPEASEGEDKFTRFTVDEGFIDNNVYAMFEDNTGNIWFGTGNGSCRFDPDANGGAGVFTQFAGAGGLKGTQISSITEDNEGNIWFGSAQGATYYTPSGKGRFTNFTTEAGLSSNNVYSILKDKGGNIWFGNSEGICRYKAKSFTHLTTEYLFPDNPIFHLSEDAGRDLWVGTNKGAGRISYGGSDAPSTLTRFSSTEMLRSADINAIAEDSRGQTWFGTASKGVFCYDPTGFDGQGSMTQFTRKEGLLTDYVRAITTDRNGDIWIGTGAVVSRYTPEGPNGPGSFTNYSVKEGFKLGMIHHMLEDSRGQIWIATGRGVSRFTPGAAGETDIFTHFSAKEGLARGEARHIMEDSRGYIWIGTDNGLSRFDPDANDGRGAFNNFTVKEGLSHNLILSVTEDKQQRIWLSTQKGITLMIPLSGDSSENDYRVITFGKEDGLIRWDFERAACLDDHNRIWWASLNGLTSLDLDNFEWSTEAPQVQLNTIDINQQTIDYRALADSAYRQTLSFGEALPLSFDSVVPFQNYPLKMALPHDLNHLTFHFSAVDLAAPHKLEYSFMLEGLEENWSLPVAENKTDYRDLSAGNYTFKVRARGLSGIWGEVFEYPFRIHPPWWASWWAFLIYGLLSLYLLFNIYRFLLKRKLEQAEIVRLQELDSFKTRLYTNITHEFRTPLTIILGMARQIKDDPGKWLEEGLRMIGRNGRQLLNLVNQMLDLSKLDKGKLKLHPQPGEIVSFMHYLVRSFEPYAHAKDIQMHLLHKVDRLAMHFDPDQLTKVVSNLLSNAVKFTPAGGHVYIGLRNLESGRLLNASDATEILEISVKDTGPGIPAAALPRIFDRFYQVDDSSTRIAAGTGVGLALAKELVQLMRGEIRVQSTDGMGTDFTVLLPVSRSASDQATDDSMRFRQPAQLESLIDMPDLPTEAANKSDLQTPAAESLFGPSTKNSMTDKTSDRPVLLLIEDDPDILTYLAAFLEADYQLEFARNGREGIELALEIVPDIIISDVMMPIKDGYEVCATLKEDIRTSHIPIILLTAKADQGARISGLKSGADAYLTKPFDKEELDVRLQKLLELRRQLQLRYNQWRPAESPSSQHLTKEELFLRDLRQTVEEKLSDESFGTSQLCRELGMSRSQLYSKVKALTGQSVALYLRGVRLEKAKSLLLQTDLNVSEVAFEVGFRTSGYFTQSFTEETGMSPTAFRKGNE